jgi:enoyl-CoA hydratase
MSLVNLSFDSDIAHLNFDDGKANVLNAASLTALEDALAEAKSARAVVFSGREGTFSGGLDLKTLPKLPRDEFQQTLRQFGRFCQSLLTFPRPVVAAVTGHAIAGGTVLLLCCDHRIGEAGEFKLGLSEVPIGMPLPTFVLRLAQHSVSKRHITEAALHGRLYPPHDAERIGYLQSVVDPGHAVGRAHQVAANLAALPNPAYLLTKSRLTAEIAATLESFDEEMEFFISSFDWSSARPRS